MTIKEQLNLLADSDRRLLNYAFEHDSTEYVRLKDGTGKETGQYIGVNAERSPVLIQEQVAGAWSIGRIKK